MTGKGLRIVRIIISILASGIITASLVGVASSFSVVGAWLESVQIFPAVLSFSIVVFVSWLLITLIFGRIYCSSVCPLGTLMDVAARLPRLTRRQRRKRHYSWRRPVPRLQYGVLVIALAAMMAGISYVVSLIDPFTVYSGIVTQCVAPLFHRILAGTMAGCLVSTVLLITIVSASALYGRPLCNTVCPVGTTLGLVSRYSIMQIDINTDRCIHCGACVDVCKASCINPADSTVDGARCVTCFDCLTVCPNDAIHYTGRRHQLSDVLMQRADTSRSGTQTATTTSLSNELNKDNPMQ